MRRRVAVVLSIISAIVLSSTCQSLHAASPFYEGKRITIIVGYGPGGGFDRMARLLSKYLPKYIPGKPTIIIQNMPGAGSIIAANYIYNIAKPDGLTIGAFGRGVPFAQLLNAAGVKFDILKYAWIGSAAVEATVLCIRSDLPYKTFNDLLKVKSPIMLGDNGPADSSGQFCSLLKALLGLHAKTATYPSGADVNLAIERKELDGRGTSYGGIKPLIERGLLRPLIRGRVSEPEIDNLPIDEDLTTDVKAKKIMAMRSAPEQVGRPYVAPPGTPTEIMKILRDAFAKVAVDPELKAEAKKLMMEVKYVPANECLTVMQGIFSQPADVVKEFSKYIKI